MSFSQAHPRKADVFQQGSPSWDSPDNQTTRFNAAVAANDFREVKRGFRAFSAELFGRQKISIDQYISVFGGHAINCITKDGSGRFVDMRTGSDASQLVRSYSRAKYGGVEDIRYFAGMLVATLGQALDSPSSHWSRLFRLAKERRENVVIMTTGWRNVPSTANVVYDLVVEHLNLKLAYLGLPTIINVKLPRIAPPCENYATLSTEERERVNLVQDHVIPDRNFYRWSGVHVIFADDVLVTGSTADKVFFESMRNGAKSFQALYPIAIDPRLALCDAAIEEELNTTFVTGQLDATIAGILAHPHYQPILRCLRLVFSTANREAFPQFVTKVSTESWIKLYKAALGNEFLQQEDCKPSLFALRDYLTGAGSLAPDGSVALP